MLHKILNMRTITLRIQTRESAESLKTRIGGSVVGLKSATLTDSGLENGVQESKIRKSQKDFDCHWDGMPRFVQEKQRPLVVCELTTFLSSEELSRIFDQPITDKTRSIWYPKLERGLGNWAWVSDSPIHHRHPIYVISKGRTQCITARALEKCGARFKIVVEPQEVEIYRERWGDRVITGDFDTTTRSSIPVRNYVDEISPSDWYWLMDDNIEDFNYLTDNQKYVARTDAWFAAVEDFVDRFSNVGQAGLNYYSFAKKTERVPPYYTNTRIYSCILMNRMVDCERENGKLWRGRYNEDTDLSIRILKAGQCTLLMNAFLAGKMTTQRLKGGNTDSVYVDGDDRLKFAESLVEQHPDCTEIAWRFKRWHHKVDYRRFNQKLCLRPSYPVRDYGLRLDENAR